VDRTAGTAAQIRHGPNRLKQNGSTGR